jgi:hypothetical protein
VNVGDVSEETITHILMIGEYSMHLLDSCFVLASSLSYWTLEMKDTLFPKRLFTFDRLYGTIFQNPDLHNYFSGLLQNSTYILMLSSRFFHIYLNSELIRILNPE